MRRPMLVTVLGIALAACQAQPAEDQPSDSAVKSSAPAPGSPEAKIEMAMAAAPAEIAAQATILDWPGAPEGKPTELRAGTNGWTCFTDNASTPAPDPLCADAESIKWAEAWMGKSTPALKALGLAYMLQGDAGASNIDPFATAATADNQWHTSGPHIMIFTPDVRQLDAVSTDHTNGAPYVMWKGTPYAHIMMPVGKL